MYFRVMPFPLFSSTFITTPELEKKIKRPFGNYWAFAAFSGQKLITNFSDGLKIMDQSFITCYDIGKPSFFIFWKHLKQLFGHLNLSFNVVLYFGNVFLTRCRFWSNWFRRIFDGLDTRIKFLFPPSKCVIRHTLRSISSRNSSHQLFQRITKFWSSFDVHVSPYFIFFLSTLLPNILLQWSMTACIQTATCMP